MPATSKAQQRLFAIAAHHPEKLKSPKLRDRMSQISTRVKEEFASTPTKNLPKRKGY